MKIGIFSANFCLSDKGGAEKTTAAVANLLVSSGMEVDILCRSSNYVGPSYQLDDRVHIRPLNLKSDREWANLSKQCFDLLVGFVWGNLYSLRIAQGALILDTRFIVQECVSPGRFCRSLTGFSVGNCATVTEAFWLRQAIYAHAAAVRFNQPAYGSSTVADTRPFTYAFYNSAGRSHSSSVISAFQSEALLERKLVCIGALRTSNKNGLAAAHAFCEFSRKFPGWSLHFYGKEGFTKELTQLRDANPRARIIQNGVVNNIDEIYRDAHALIIPSFDEGMPNVLIEAFTYGVPCIGFSDCPGVSDTINHEVNGLLADRSDPDSLTSALLRISDPGLRNELGRNAKAFAHENFSYDKWAANWLRMVHNAVEGLNNEGRPQRPAALDPGHPRSTAWSTLLQCHLGRV